MTRFTQVFLLASLLSSGAWPTPSAAGNIGASTPRATCQDQYVIAPAGGAIETSQKLSLRAEVIHYGLVFGHCVVLKTSYLPASWTATGGDLDVLNGGREAVFSATTTGEYMVTATFKGHSPSVPVFVQLHNEHVLFNFGCSSCGLGPWAGLLAGSNGILFGTTAGDFGCRPSQTCGNVFELMPRSAGYVETVLHTFAHGSGDGANPVAPLITDTGGALYGTTEYGGTYGDGTVFKLTPHGSGYTESILYNFMGGSDGANPFAALLDVQGVLYGTTGYGGSHGLGTVFRLTPHGSAYTETILYSFQGGNDGANPYSSLIADQAGGLYGTTQAGGGASTACGLSGCGTVFKLTTVSSGYSESVLYAFQGSSDGVAPYANVISNAQGNLYGTTFWGGACLGTGCGTVFELKHTASGYTESVLYRFHGPDGRSPEAGLIAGPHGTLFGTTVGGGWSGVVFKLTPAGSTYTETVLHTFADQPNDGAQPIGGVIADAHGALLGTTSLGGQYTNGIVFKITP